MSQRWQIHMTSLNKLAHCGVAFERRYMLGEKEPTKPVLMVGSAVDEAVTMSLQNKLNGSGLLTDPDIRDIAKDSIDYQFKNYPYALDADQKTQGLQTVINEAVAKAQRLASLHNTEVAPGIQVTAVQQRFSLNMDDFLASRNLPLNVDIVGTRDIDESFDEYDAATEAMIPIDNIRDTKTAAKTPAADAADDSDQLTGYALAYWFDKKILPGKLTLDFLVDLKRGAKAVTLATTRTEADIDVLLNRIEAAARVITTGAFMPTKADDPMCSPKYCGFHPTCKYVKRPKLITIGAKQNVSSINTSTSADPTTDGE